MSLIFVYGTLKRGCRNHAYLGGQGFVGEARTAPGFRLFDLGEYPGMVPHPDDRDGVIGEVWSVDAAALARLDVLEGTAENLYERKAIPLLPPFAAREVETYLYLGGIEGRPAVGPVWSE
jgi:gamma-glutamylaminecyclotransferase